jgi:hypothetical protein
MDSEKLTAQLDQLRREVAGLRNEQRRAGPNRVCAALGAGLAAGFILSQVLLGSPPAIAQTEAKGMVCRFLKVVDAAGKEMVIFGADDDGGYVKIMARDGSQRAFLGVNDKAGSGFLHLSSPEKKSNVILDNDASGGAIKVYARDGKQRVFLGVAPNLGGGLLNLFDPERKLRLILDGAAAGGIIERR